jgi:hypothetical protein
VISGKLPNVRQFVMGGFEVAQKIDAQQACEQFPDQRLQMRDDGQLTGNIIVDESGAQHKLDNHDPATFTKRISNYIVGTDCISLLAPEESHSAASKRSMFFARFLRRTVDPRLRSSAIMAHR